MNTREDVNQPADLRDLCLELAEQAAQLVRERRATLTGGSSGGGEVEVTTKSSDVDPVTEVDKAAERYIADRIAAERPDDGILGEEGSDVAGTTGVQWIVDPIDGTVNFLYGLPMYSVSVGVAVDGELVAGAVCNAATGELYSASRGAGAHVTRGGETTTLRASDATNLGHALVATGFSYSSQWRGRQAEILTRVLPAVRDIRRMGSAALDLCALAEGRVDAYYEHGTHPWDWAAGAIIAHEAGAVVNHGDLADNDRGRVMFAAAPGIAEGFAALLDASGALHPLG